MGDTYVIADEKMLSYIAAKNLYGWAMSESLPNDGTNF